MGFENGNMVSELLSTIDLLEIARCSPEVSEIILPYLKASGRLRQQHKILKKDVHSLVRWFRKLLDRKLVELDSLRAYKEPSGIGGVGTRILLAALEEGDKDIVGFMASNCVTFDDPKVFLKLILKKNVSAVELWVNKNACVNAQWEHGSNLNDDLTPGFCSRVKRTPNSKYSHILTDTIIAFSNRRPSADREAAALGISYRMFIRDSQERNFKITRLLLKAPTANLNLQGIRTFGEVHRPGFRQCSLGCRRGFLTDGRCYENCRLAPRPWLNFSCGEKDCFCLRHPLPGPLLIMFLN
ncbi:hypothetical protein TWF506_002846 [Arthrobotrys conoides]|uniref:Uncharacterized protein n=1 Tax=Arthrobotrys conoides TaxID=74498 RepID=A0AAN8NM78_9PEZI